MTARPEKKPRRSGPRAEAVVFVRLTTEERKEIDAAAKRDDRPVAAWVRHVALLAARTPKARADRSTPS